MTNSQLRAGPSRLNAQPVVQPAVRSAPVQRSQAPIELEPWDENAVEPVFVPTKTHAQLTEEMLEISGCRDEALNHPVLGPLVMNVIKAAAVAKPFTSAGQQKEFESMLLNTEIKMRCTLGSEADRREAEAARQRPVQQQPVYVEKRDTTQEDATIFMATTMKYQAHAQTAAMRGWNSCNCQFCQEYRNREGMSPIASRSI